MIWAPEGDPAWLGWASVASVAARTDWVGGKESSAGRGASDLLDESVDLVAVVHLQLHSKSSGSADEKKGRRGMQQVSACDNARKNLSSARSLIDTARPGVGSIDPVDRDESGGRRDSQATSLIQRESKKASQGRA